MTDQPPFDPQLFDRYHAGDLSPADRQQVESWLASHAATSQLLRALPRASLGAAAQADTNASWQALESRIHLAGSGDDLAMRRERNAASTPAARPAPWVRRAAAVAAALLVVAGGVAVWRTTRGGELVAPRGRDVTATLSDGSYLTLSAGSRARWPASFGTKSRDIALEGQAFFDVVHDATRPFRVHTRDAIAEDVGTRFVVRAWPELPAVEVAVETGLVALTDTLHVRDATATVLRAGQLGRLGPDGTVAVVPDADVALAWARGQLVFENSTLTEVLPAISRRFGVDLRADPALADRRLSARFATQSLPELLNALAVSLDVTVESRGRAVTLHPTLR